VVGDGGRRDAAGAFADNAQRVAFEHRLAPFTVLVVVPRLIAAGRGSIRLRVWVRRGLAEGGRLGIDGPPLA
jgi:hypothetical protein